MRLLLDRMLSRQAVVSKKKGAGTCCNVASPATVSTQVLVSITVHQCVHQIASGADVAARILAKGAQEERERHTWAGEIVGHSGFYEKPGFLFQRMSTCMPSCGEAPCKPVPSLGSARRARTSVSF